MPPGSSVLPFAFLSEPSQPPRAFASVAKIGELKAKVNSTPRQVVTRSKVQVHLAGLGDIKTMRSVGEPQEAHPEKSPMLFRGSEPRPNISRQENPALTPEGNDFVRAMSISVSSR